MREYLLSHSTLTLATSSGDRPWAAAVFYACDEELRLYFVSDPATLHAIQSAANPNVAATIHEHDQRWESIRGVQIEGRLGVVGTAERSRVEALFAKRFPDVAADELLGERIAAATFYVLTPGRLRFIDNTRGFGHRDEYILDERSRHR